MRSTNCGQAPREPRDGRRPAAERTHADIPARRVSTHNVLARFGRLTDPLKEVITGVLAATANHGANTAVLVVRGVEIAFLGAGEARRRTGFDHGSDKTEIRRGLPSHDPPGGIAHIGAIHVEPDAADQLWQIALRETGVCAGGAAGGTVDTLGDTAEKKVAIHTARHWMQVDDLAKSQRALPL